MIEDLLAVRKLTSKSATFACWLLNRDSAAATSGDPRLACNEFNDFQLRSSWSRTQISCTVGNNATQPTLAAAAEHGESELSTWAVFDIISYGQNLYYAVYLLFQYLSDVLPGSDKLRYIPQLQEYVHTTFGTNKPGSGVPLGCVRISKV